MRSDKTFFEKWATVIVLTVVALTPLLFVGVQGAMRGGNNDVRQWLPTGFQETRDYDWFLERFGSEEMAIVSWPGATLDDDRIDRVAEGLRAYAESAATVARPEGAVRSNEGPLFSRVITTREVLDTLTAEPLNLSESEAAKRLQGTLLGPDGRTAGLIVMVNEAGAADRKSALGLVEQVARQEAGLSPDELRMGGPTVESVSLDSESNRSRYLLASISVVVALLLAWRCLKQVRLVASVFATAILCAATSVALVYATGGTMNLLLVMMPTLVYVLALSGSVHLVHYYHDAKRNGHETDAPLRAVRSGWFPCLLSAFTTAIGLGSLGISQVIPVKLFGLYSALGVLVSLPILLLVLPALLQLWPARPGSVSVDARHDGRSPLATGIVLWLSRYHRWVTVAAAAVMLTGFWGISQLETSVKLLNLFSPQSRIIQDYHWLERHFGALVPVEVVVRFDETNRLNMLQRMEVVGEVQRELASLDEVGGTMSAMTFAPELPSSDGVTNTVRRRMVLQSLEKNRDQFVDLKYLQQEGSSELWRVSARVQALNSLDYGEFMSRLTERVEPVLKRASSANEEPEAVYTGIVPLIYKAQRTLLNDLMTSFMTAFLIVGGVMIVTLRSIPAGLVSMVPNMFPAVTAFGAMGLSGMLCDIGSMMTAGVALGIAVDDTIHYLSWFRRGLDQGLSRRQAIGLAYRRCAGAMIQTTVICGFGLLAFAFSSFVPTSRFAWLMATMLGTALVGDLLLLPALLTGPLGRFFDRGRAVRDEAEKVLPEGTSVLRKVAAG